MVFTLRGFSRFQITFYILAVWGLILMIPIDFPFVHNHGNKPDYVNMEHDVCQAVGWLFVYILAYYMAMFAAILSRGRQVLEYDWMARVVIIYCFINCFVLLDSIFVFGLLFLFFFF
jgi:hypothetical protein